MFWAAVTVVVVVVTQGLGCWYLQVVMGGMMTTGVVNVVLLMAVLLVPNMLVERVVFMIVATNSASAPGMENCDDGQVYYG